MTDVSYMEVQHGDMTPSMRLSHRCRHKPCCKPMVCLHAAQTHLLVKAMGSQCFTMNALCMDSAE